MFINREIFKMLVWRSAFIASLSATSAFSADVTPMGTSESTATGKVSTAKIVRPDTYRVGVTFDGADAMTVDKEYGNRNTISSGHQSSINFTYGMTKYFQLDLGLRGSHEVVSHNVRTDINEDFDTENVETNQLKETAYSGARLVAKYKLITNRNLHIAIAPFLEEGMGQKAKNSLTRSQKARAGFLTMLSYGHTGVGEINLNAGMRYRDPEVLGHVILRNEMIGKANVKAYLNRNISLFGAVGVRRLMVANQNKRDTKNNLVYLGKDSGEALLGMTFKAGSTTFSMYGGTDLIEDSSYGFGKNSYGLSMITKLGGNPKRYKWISEKKSSRPKAGKWSPKTGSKQKETKDLYPEMNGNVDHLSNVPDGVEDDFDRLKNKMKKKRKKNGKEELSTEELVDKELAELRAAEKKVEQAKLKRKKNTRKQRLSRAKKASSKEKKRVARIRQQAEQDLDDDYSITVDDVSWDGLED